MVKTSINLIYIQFNYNNLYHYRNKFSIYSFGYENLLKIILKKIPKKI
ncbi:MAG: hypothetical protein BAJALOKI3v1_740019 [Promethearchaeota archaeon]|nr:MAG: hypothetical protein BAJALOKI3v1_740019 [Candidatus Lokiarchaeota archaeon]